MYLLVVCGEKEIEMDRRNVVNPLALDCMHRPANRSNECYGGDIWPPESRINEKVYMLCVGKKGVKQSFVMRYHIASL